VKRICLFIALLAILISQPSESLIHPANASNSVLSGRGWAYNVPFRVQNTATIAKLIQCESQGVNIARPDSNGLISWGVLQFNGTSTWADMEQRFSFTGSPMIPADAIRMADMMIAAGFLGRWTCARILHLSPPNPLPIPTLSTSSAQLKRR
jgi:hypothetical protein